MALNHHMWYGFKGPFDYLTCVRYISLPGGHSGFPEVKGEVNE